MQVTSSGLHEELVSGDGSAVTVTSLVIIKRAITPSTKLTSRGGGGGS